MASAFTGTSTVENDVSIIKWEYDEFRESFMYFSLEGVLQSKQYEKLVRLAYALAIRE